MIPLETELLHSIIRHSFSFDTLPISSSGNLSDLESAAFFGNNQDREGENEEVSFFSTVTNVTVTPEAGITSDFDSDDDIDGSD